MKKLVVLGLICLMALLGAGCGKHGTDTAAQKPSVLTVGWDFDMVTADPVKSGYFVVRSGMMETLVDVDYEGKLAPGLATGWQQTDDFTWKITLRPNVKFHDGSSMTAQSVKAVIERFADVAKTIPLKKVEIISDTELLVVTETPLVALPAYLATPEAVVYSPNAIVNGKFEKLIGTGPYKLVKVGEDKSLVTEAFMEYWKGAPKISQVINRQYPDAQARFMALQSGEINLMRNVPPANAKILQGSKEYTAATSPIGRVRLMYLNTERDGLKEEAVRKALNCAIDRAGIIATALEGVGQPAVGLFPPNLPWGNPRLQAVTYSQDNGKALLEGAGWLDRNGVREKDGKRLEFTLMTYSSRPELPVIAQVLQGQLAAVGIKLNIQVADTGAAEKAMVSKNFDMVLVARGLAFTPDPSIAFEDFRTGSKSKYRPNYVNGEVDQLLEIALKESDKAKRQAAYDRVQEILAQDVPVIFLNYYVHIDAHASGLKNYKIHPTEAHMITSDLSF